MNKIDELIAQFGDYDIPFEPLCKHAKRNKGMAITAETMKRLDSPDGDVKVFAAGSTVAFIKSSNLPKERIIDKKTIIVKSRGYIGFEYYIGKFTHKGEMWSYSDFDDKLDLKYTYYYLLVHTEEFQRKARANSVKLPQLCVADTDNFCIPILPLPVQQEIVRILDSFTDLQDNLQQELESREKQYHEYQSIILSFDGSSVPRYKVGDMIVSLKTGLNPRKNFVLNSEGSSCPYVTGKDIYNNTINVSVKTDRITEHEVEMINRRACLEDNLLLFASTGTGTVGRMALVKQYNHDWSISETLYAIKPRTDIISTAYLMYSLYSEDARKQFEPKISKGSVPHLKIVDLLNVIIPVPSLKEQAIAVSKLDAFEGLIRNLQDEVSARQKQYEYYREQLLSF